MLQEAEVIVVGSGLVGLATTISLLQQNRKVCLIGKESPTLPNPANRVVALNLASKGYLEALNAWQELNEESFTTYYNMKVWEKDSHAFLSFNHEEANTDCLGYIVINSELEKALWKVIDNHKKNKPNSFIYINDFVNGYQNLSNRHIVSTANQQVLGTFLVIADGARSFLRSALNIGVNREEYGQTAITTVVELDQSHQNTCYQSFHKNGILAYLPLSSANQCSIVWSVNSDIVNTVLSYDNERFAKEMFACFDKTELGIPKIISNPTAFPLAKQYAQEIHGTNFAIIGDAAHTIHPLAGQGVNLGFADAWQLADLFRDYYRSNKGIDNQHLSRWARKRKAKAVLTSESMSVIKKVFCSNNSILEKLGGLALNFVNHSKTIKREIINNALGYGDTPYSQAKFDSSVNFDNKQVSDKDIEEAVNSIK